MEPEIRYVRTTDGVSIAYATAGDGPCVIFVPSPPLSHVQRQWHIMPELYRGMAQRFRLVWYDSRGSGLSDRDAIDFSMPAMIRELEAVTDRAGGRQFVLFGLHDAVPVAITYAAARPDRVSHLILGDGRTKASDYFRNPARIEAETALRSQDWIVYTETFSRVLLGFKDPLAAQYAEHIRACVEPEALRASYAAQMSEDFDVPAEVVASISAPTLVFHNRKNRFLPVQSSQRIASSISDARFLVIDDMTYRELPALISDFIGEAGGADQESTPLPSGMAVILFADIVDSTALMESMGDQPFRDKARDLDAAMRRIIREHSGTPVEGKLLGDGVLAVFQSAAITIEAAIQCGRAGDQAGLPLHLGVHAGDVIREGNNVYGGAVNIGSRIAGESMPGEVLISETVRSLARTSSSASFEDRGEHSLKGVADPQRLFAVKAVA